MEKQRPELGISADSCSAKTIPIKTFAFLVYHIQYCLLVCYAPNKACSIMKFSYYYPTFAATDFCFKQMQCGSCHVFVHTTAATWIPVSAFFKIELTAFRLSRTKYGSVPRCCAAAIRLALSCTHDVKFSGGVAT